MNKHIGTALLLAACGAPPEDAVVAERKQDVWFFPGNDGRLAGTQAHDAQSPPGSPNHQCTEGQNSGVTCLFVDPEAAGEGLPRYGVHVATGFSTYYAGLIDDILEDLLPLLTEKTKPGVSPIYAEFYRHVPGQGAAEIVISPHNFPTSTANLNINAYALSVFGGLQPAFTESPATANGTWRKADVCTIRLDATDLSVQGRAALLALGESPSDWSLFRQVIGNKILACVGLGKRHHPTVTNGMSFTHDRLTRNVNNNPDMITQSERCAWFDTARSATFAFTPLVAQFQPSYTNCGSLY